MSMEKAQSKRPARAWYGEKPVWVDREMLIGSPYDLSVTTDTGDMLEVSGTRLQDNLDIQACLAAGIYEDAIYASKWDPSLYAGTDLILAQAVRREAVRRSKAMKRASQARHDLFVREMPDDDRAFENELRHALDYEDQCLPETIQIPLDQLRVEDVIELTEGVRAVDVRRVIGIHPGLTLNLENGVIPVQECLRPSSLSDEVAAFIEGVPARFTLLGFGQFYKYRSVEPLSQYALAAEWPLWVMGERKHCSVTIIGTIYARGENRIKVAYPSVMDVGYLGSETGSRFLLLRGGEDDRPIPVPRVIFSTIRKVYELMAWTSPESSPETNDDVTVPAAIKSFI
jgi:hypothetical protein